MVFQILRTFDRALSYRIVLEDDLLEGENP